MRRENGKKRFLLLCIGAVLCGNLAGCAAPAGEARRILESIGNELNASSEQAADGGLSGSSFSFKSVNPLDIGGNYEDHLPQGTSLFVNRAVSFYYYSVLSEEEQTIYNALWAVVQDPTSTEYRKKITVTADPNSDAFSEEMNRAYEALIYDHPELFWFRQNNGNFRYYYHPASGLDGQYTVMIQLSEPYTNYQQEMTAFNQAADNFLADIDLTQSQPMVALAIHDKLIDMVTYDDDLAASYDANGDYDYGYSAYGALVANSRGQEHTAVCDGYSYAYEYLCQQAGLTVTRVGGYAGKDTSSMEGHSWNLICLDGDWYEVDPTWDDQEADDSDTGGDGGEIIAQAEADTAFWNRIRHYMFNLTTAEISNYTPDDSYTYYTGNGGYATFLTSSVHVRDDGSDPEKTGDYLSYLAPQAEGTKYTYDTLISGGGSAEGAGSEPDTGSGQDPLLRVDADGDGEVDNPAYRDEDQDGYVDNWQDFTQDN